MAAGVLWLHALPGCLPDDDERAVAGLREARRAKARDGSGSSSSASIPSATRPRCSRILCQSFAAPITALTGTAGQVAAGRQGLPRLLRQAPDARMAATTWTTARVIYVMDPQGASPRLSPSTPRTTPSPRAAEAGLVGRWRWQRRLGDINRERRLDRSRSPTGEMTTLSDEIARRRTFRDHLAPRRRQDHADREAAAVRRRDPARRRGQGARRAAARALGLDGDRARARHLGHRRR